MNIDNILTRAFRKCFFRVISAAVIPSLTLTACQGGEEMPAVPGVGSESDNSVVTLNISTSQFGNMTTRAEESDTQPSESPVTDNELINNWVVAIFQNGELKGKAEGSPSTASDDPKAVWKDQLTFLLSPGTYTAIALANMDAETVRNVLEDLDFSGSWTDEIFNEPLSFDNGDLIPMSGYKKFTVEGASNESFDIEVVRMRPR